MNAMAKDTDITDITDTTDIAGGTADEASACPDAQDTRVSAAVSYSEAQDELKKILADLESDRLDIDEVAVHVERASALVAHCHEKVSGARAKLRAVTADQS